MKYTLTKDKQPSTYWNGVKPLPDTIHVISHQMHVAELELLTMICTLHGHVTAFDLLTGAEPSTEKDNDLNSVLTAFQQYIYPKMPLSHYTGTDQRNPHSLMKQKAIELP